MLRRKLPLLLIACTSPLLCSCRAPMQSAPARGARSVTEGSFSHGESASAPRTARRSDHIPAEDSAVVQVSAELPDEAYTGHPDDGFTQPGAIPGHMRPPGFESPMQAGPPLPRMVYGPWAPPGFKVPWPEQEYLRDGGDRDARVMVRQDWRVDGLDLEDTVAHYDTLDGRTIVEPSNEVCLYAPRFAAVRRVDNLFEGQQQAKAGGHTQPVALINYEEKQFASTKMQPVQPIGEAMARRPNTLKGRDFGVPIFTVLMPAAVQDRLKPHENFAIFRTGVMEAAEKPFLAQAAQAAEVWETKQAVQIILEGRRAQADVSVAAAQATYRIDEPGNPELRLCKTASATSALPGEEVHFTLRFDNVGGEVIGNVTIIDNLTTRLEYVPGSAQSSVGANFSVEPNHGDSLALRWEVIEPLAPGDGGLVRFTCRVR